MRGKFHLLETSGLHSECARTDEKLLCHNNSRTTKGSKTRVGGVGVGGGTFCCVAKCCIILQQFVSSETTSTSRFWVPLTCYSACFAVFLPLIQFFYSLLLCFIVFTLFHYMKLHEFYCITFRFDVLKDNINIYFS